MSLFAAMVFIAHPLQTETVTYIVQRMNSLAVMFFLVAFLFYIRGRRTSRRPVRWALYCGCFVSWMLALGSKETAAIFPVIVWLYEWCFFGSLSKDWFKRNLGYTLGAAILFGAVAAAYIGGNPLEGIVKDYAIRDFTLGERVLTQFRVIIFYIGLVVYPNPSRLNLLHDFSISRSLFEPITTLFSLITLVSLLGLAIYLGNSPSDLAASSEPKGSGPAEQTPTAGPRTHRLMSFCILWFFATLAIESSVIGLEMIFEHRLYLPMVGVALLASQTLFSLTSQRRILRVLIGAVLIALLGTATYLRNRVWQDEITLWSDVVAKNGNSSRAHNNLGIALAATGRLDDAVQHYTEAVRIDPNNAPAHSNLGLVLRSQGRLQEAAAHFREVVRIVPTNAAARDTLGLTLAAAGQIEEAKQHFLEALRIDPTSAAAHNHLGLALAQEGRLDQAQWHFLEALRIDPTSATVHNSLGLTFAAEGRLEEAAQQYSTALDIQPEFAEAYNNLGEARVRQGRLDEAIRHFSAALRIQPDYRKARTNLERASQALREPPSQRGVANQP